MEAGNPLLDDYVLSLPEQRAAARVLPALRQRRRRPLHRALLPRVRRRPLRAVAHLAVPARPRARRLPRAPARAGPDLRRRGQRAEPAGRVARARDRRGAARGLRGGGGALRGERRLAVLVRGGRDRLPRRPRGPTRAWACCRGATPCTTTPSAAAATSTAASCWTACAPGFAAEDGTRAALRERAAAPRRWPPGRAPARSGCAWRATAGWRARRCARSTWATARGTLAPRRRPTPSACGWRDASPPASSPWAAGGFTGSVEDSPLDEYVLDARTRATRPRVCLIPTASGDPEAQIDRFYRAFEPLGCELSHVSLFRLGSHPMDLREHLLSRDVIYVGGGSMLNLLALWRVHGVDSLLAEAWQKGVALVGVSAGSMCWFEARHHAHARRAGPGDRPGPAAVHASPCTTAADPKRRAEYRARDGGGHARRLRGRGRGGAAVRRHRASPRPCPRGPSARAYRVELEGSQVVERVIEPRLLTADGAAARCPSRSRSASSARPLSGARGRAGTPCAPARRCSRRARRRCAPRGGRAPRPASGWSRARCPRRAPPWGCRPWRRPRRRC